MIRLLRRTRKDKVEKGKFGSYLLHALGENILVVVGILVAI